MLRAAAFLLVSSAVLAGCGSNQSALKPHSRASGQIDRLWWIMLAGSGVVVAIVIMLLVVAVARRHARRDDANDGRAKLLILAGGVVAPILVLSALFALAVRTLPATSAPAAGRTALTVEVVGRQWFWDVRYPGNDVLTANEIHIPAGETVRLVARTADVIHSFWVPELNRKIDMIPGRRNAIALRADRPGVYRGQCAEFCGLQHAHMALLVYADPPARFRAWLSVQGKKARAPAGPAVRRGEQVFLDEGCSGCHAIRGTPADAHVGPDLTHLASRSTLAADTIPNTRGYLGGWILDPQHVKPGNRMPGFDLRGRELGYLLDYLQSLR